jgi:hypothetical protein
MLAFSALLSVCPLTDTLYPKILRDEGRQYNKNIV